MQSLLDVNVLIARRMFPVCTVSPPPCSRAEPEIREVAEIQGKRLSGALQYVP